MHRLLLFLVTALVPASTFAADVSVARERLLLDFNWKFHLGDDWKTGENWAKAGRSTGPAGASNTFDTSKWRSVHLPHDWGVELLFDKSADKGHGYKALGQKFPANSVGWYRRAFTLPKADTGKRLWLEFDGVFRDSTVFVNGWRVGHQDSGYHSFRFDITDVAHVGETNVIAVRVDASQIEGWFYEGAGIYRHVWLVKTDPLAIAPDGIFVYSRFRNNVPEGAADVRIQARIANSQTNEANATVLCEVIGPDGRVAATAKQPLRLAPWTQQEIELSTRVRSPELWSPESPKLYKLVTSVESNGRTIDRVETEFGIRTFAFDVEKGFLLNGKPYVLKGTCNHQDHAGVGVALPDRLQYFRVARLKEMGCNAYRTSHNPPTAELLEACDRLGMLVMDENRLLGSSAENLALLEGFVRRDRNHASVGIWSIANEEHVQNNPDSASVALTMQRLIKRLDPTRPVTYAANNRGVFTGINSVIEVRGWNYRTGPATDQYHKDHPTQPNLGTEDASTVSTRGIYFNDRERGYLSAYDTNIPSWGKTAEGTWTFYAARPWLAGVFIWTGFDYRGEPTPYSWPCIGSHFGIIDLCGFPKDNFYYYQSWWTDQIVLHLLPHWNWAGKEGQEIEVRALSNCDEVELILNGQSIGRQQVKKNSHARWSVKYAPGTLRARGYKAGKLAAEQKIETTEAPAALQLTPDRAAIHADGEDISLITVAVADAQGRLVPTASNLVEFQLEGPGRILGVGNGDPSCHEADFCVDGWKRSLFNGLAQIIVQSSKQPGDLKLTARAEGMSPTTLVIPTTPSEARRTD